MSLEAMKNMFLVIAIGLSCSSCTPAPSAPLKSSSSKVAASASQPATYGEWRSVKMGGGGYIQNVVVSPSNPNRLYSYVDVGGLFRSDDGGKRWRMLHGALPARNGIYEVRGLVVDPRDDKRVLAAIGSQWNAPEGIYLSNDAGNTWKKVLTARFMGNGPERWTGFVLARHPQNPDIVFTASEETGIFRSTDGGKSWKYAGQSGLHPTDIRFDRANPNRIWLCAQPFKGWVDGGEKTLSGGFFRSEDGGASWRKIADSGPSEILQDPKNARILYGIIDQVVYKSENNGDSWQVFNAGLPARDSSKQSPSDSEFQALASGPDFIVTASTRGTFYRLKSGDSNWQKIERQGIEEIYEGEEWFRHKTGGFGWALGSITVHPKNANHWFFTDWFAIYQSFDAGKNWKLTIDGIEVTVLHSLTQDPFDAGVVHLGMADNGYFFSENGGERFYNGEGISNNVKSISVSRAQPNRVYAVGPQTWHWEANQVFVSIDRGHSWTRSPMEGLPDLAKDGRKCNTIIVDPKNPYLVYLAVSGNVAPGAGGIYRSEDGGRKWSWIGEGLPKVDKFFRESIWDRGREIAVSPDGTVMLITMEQGQAFRYDEKLKKWELANLPTSGDYFSIIADNLTPGRFYLSRLGGGLYRSDDSAKTWKQVFKERAGLFSLDEAVKNRLAVAADDGVMISTNAGETWKALDKKLPYRVGLMMAFAGERLVVGTGGNGAFWIPLSTQGARPVKAKPVVEAKLPAQNVEVPAVPNGNMSLGTDKPASWGNLWQGDGKMEVLRDTSTYKSAPASLLLQSLEGAGHATVSQNFPAVKGRFKVRAWIKTSGQIEESALAVQSYGQDDKQNGWTTVADARGKKEWTQVEQTMSLPPNTKNWNLVLLLKGNGKAWLDEVEILPSSDVFLP